MHGHCRLDAEQQSQYLAPESTQQPVRCSPDRTCVWSLRFGLPQQLLKALSNRLKVGEVGVQLDSERAGPLQGVGQGTGQADRDRPLVTTHDLSQVHHALAPALEVMAFSLLPSATLMEARFAFSRSSQFSQRCTVVLMCNSWLGTWCNAWLRMLI